MADNNDSLQGTQNQLMCAKGCGFFGSASTMNMCSKCFREHQKATSGDVPSSASSPSSPAHPPQSIQRPDELVGVKDSPAVVSIPSPSLQPAPSVLPNVGELAAIAPTRPSSEPQPSHVEEMDDTGVPPPRKIQKNTNRCFSCRKKVGLTGFKCRCGYVYCGEHRYSDKHGCDFDYKSEAKAQLEKANPVVVASKIDRI